jgi:hypothetical protein
MLPTILYSRKNSVPKRDAATIAAPSAAVTSLLINVFRGFEVLKYLLGNFTPGLSGRFAGYHPAN